MDLNLIKIENTQDKPITSIELQNNTCEQIKNSFIFHNKILEHNKRHDINQNDIGCKTITYAVELNGLSKFDFMKKIMSILEFQINNYLISDVNNYDPEYVLQVELPDISTWPFDGMCIETKYTNSLYIKILLDTIPRINFTGIIWYWTTEESHKIVGIINGIIQLLTTNMPNVSFTHIKDINKTI